MAKTALPITTGFYESDSVPISSQRAVNWYVNFPQADTVTEGNLFGTPGLNQLGTVSPIDKARGSHEMAGIPYWVIGNKLYRLNRSIDVDGNETFTTSDLGTIEGSGRVSMDDNGTQLCIVVPGGKAYTFIEPATLAEITDVNFDGPADSVVFIDQFFNFTKTGGKKFFNSPVGDGRGLPSGTAYDALDFTSAEADPDNITGQIKFNNQLYVMGSQTTEQFRNIGRSPAPFVRTPGAVFDKGLSAPFSLIKGQNTFVMIGAGENEAPAVWAFAGSGFTKISSTAIDNLLRKLTDAELSAVFAWTYGEAGAYFVGFQLPDTTLVYDFIAKRWHERQSLDVQGADIPYRVASMVTAYGRILVGDTQDGRIGEIDKERSKEYGGFIKRTLITRPFDNLGQNVSVASLEAVMESGVGVNNLTVDSIGQTLQVDEDPQIRLSWSDDGGRVFTDELRRGIGKTGEYERRAVWNRLGDFNRSRTMRFIMTDPVRSTFIKLEADIS